MLSEKEYINKLKKIARETSNKPHGTMDFIESFITLYEYIIANPEHCYLCGLPQLNETIKCNATYNLNRCYEIIREDKKPQKDIERYYYCSFLLNQYLDLVSKK